jgi:hypothetical protein
MNLYVINDTNYSSLTLVFLATLATGYEEKHGSRSVVYNPHIL